MRGVYTKVIAGCLCLLLMACGSVAGDPGQSSPRIPSTAQNTPTSLAPSSSLATPTGQPTGEARNLQESISANSVVLYSKQSENESFPLLAWPELSVLNQPEFCALYGTAIGYQYLSDFAPQLNATGRYLMVPGIQQQGEDPSSAKPDEQSTWVADLNNGKIHELAQRPSHAVWSPDGNQLAYVKDDTLYLDTVNENDGTGGIFTESGLSPLFTAWSPDGRQLALVSQAVGESVDGSYPPITNTVWLVSTEDNSTQQLGAFPAFPVEHNRRELQWSPDGSALLVGMVSPNYIVQLDGSQSTLPENSKGLAWIPGGVDLLIQQEEGLVITDQKGQPVISVTDAKQRVTAWDFSSDGRYLAYAYARTEGESTQVAIFDLEKGETTLSGLAPTQTITALYWTAANNALILDDGDYNTPIWAMALEESATAEVLIEEGILINVIPSSPLLETAVSNG